jgi:hypothetical protein
MLAGLFQFLSIVAVGFALIYEMQEVIDDMIR